MFIFLERWPLIRSIKIGTIYTIKDVFKEGLLKYPKVVLKPDNPI
jgi:hypothetical protein